MVKGKKPGRKATATDSDAPKKKTATWLKSNIPAKTFQSMEREGLIPPENAKAWRRAGKETTPVPHANEHVAFVDHISRGLSFPLHPFVLAVLAAYDIQLHDLLPNSVQHLACFIVLCECFLGVAPHWVLWKRIFVVKPQPSKTDLHEVGGCNLQVNPQVEYLEMKFSQSAQGWRSRWFYVKDEASADGEPLVKMGVPVIPRKSWRNELTAEEKRQTDGLMDQIATL
jgi:hypothetical protein